MIDRFEIEVERPTWARWRATDKDGTITYYKNRPCPYVTEWSAPGRWLKAHKGPLCPNWRDSLVELEPKIDITPPEVVRRKEIEELWKEVAPPLRPILIDEADIVLLEFIMRAICKFTVGEK